MCEPTAGSHRFVATCAAFVHDPYDAENPMKVVQGQFARHVDISKDAPLVAGVQQSESDAECTSLTDVDSLAGSSTDMHEEDGAHPAAVCPTVLRPDLLGFVPFAMYDPGVLQQTGLSLRCPAPPERLRPVGLTQLFFGQLPAGTSDSVIIWLCRQLAGAEVLYIERLMKRSPSAQQMVFTEDRCCMQVFVDAREAAAVIHALNKRVLFDTYGVWIAADHEQMAILAAHCAAGVRPTPSLPTALPSRTLVVEMSTSTFVRGRRKQQPPPYSFGPHA